MSLDRLRTAMQMPPYKISLALFAASLAILVTSTLTSSLSGVPAHIGHALWGGSIAAAATALGAFPALFIQRPSQRTQDALFGFGAGVMLAASIFSLILPGLTTAAALGHDAYDSVGIMAALPYCLARPC